MSNPFDELALHAIREYEAGRTVGLGEMKGRGWMALHNVRYTMKEAGKARLEVDGQEIGGFRSVRMSVGMDSFPTVDVEILARPQQFEVQGRFEPLLELPDIEERVARDLYIRLRDRFAAEDLLPGEDGG